MSSIPHDTDAFSVQDIQVEYASGSSADAIVQLLVAARRTLEQVTVLAAYENDAPTMARTKHAMRSIGNAMDERILRSLT